jgi:hypothetical protein
MANPPLFEAQELDGSRIRERAITTDVAVRQAGEAPASRQPSMVMGPHFREDNARPDKLKVKT